MAETKLKTIMAKQAVNQPEMRKRTGLALSSINEAMNGVLQNYNLNTLYKYCKALGKTPNDILDFEEKCGFDKKYTPTENNNQK